MLTVPSGPIIDPTQLNKLSVSGKAETPGGCDNCRKQPHVR